MSHKLLPRLGSAIASTILSYAAVSLVGVDKAQAAVLNYTFNTDGGPSSLDYFKVDNSSLTGIGYEEIAVSEGRFYGYTLEGGKEYYNLAGAARALFFEGVFRGLNAGGGDQVIREIIIPPDEPFGPLYVKVDRRISWRIETAPSPISSVGSLLDGYFEEYTTYNSGSPRLSNRNFFRDSVSYTLVDTAPSPVPEPLTAGGTALALAGLSWLKHKKKMAA